MQGIIASFVILPPWQFCAHSIEGKLQQRSSPTSSHPISKYFTDVYKEAEASSSFIEQPKLHLWWLIGDPCLIIGADSEGPDHPFLHERQ